METTKKRYAVRMAPCSSYDVERMANWLEEMAQRGYFLEKTMGCLILFQRGEPKKLRYRLCELPEENLFNDRTPSEEEELIAICEASGWQYIAKRGMFGIFATVDDTLPELQTETNPLYKRYIAFLLYALLGSLAIAFYPRQGFNGITIQLLISVAVWLPIMFWGQAMPGSIGQIGNLIFIAAMVLPNIWNCFVIDGFFNTWQTVGSTAFISVLLAVVFLVFEEGYFLIGPLKYFYKMLRQQPLDYSKDWRNGTVVYRITTIGLLLSVIFIFGNLLSRIL